LLDAIDGTIWLKIFYTAIILEETKVVSLKIRIVTGSLLYRLRYTK